MSPWLHAKAINNKQVITHIMSENAGAIPTYGSALQIKLNSFNLYGITPHIKIQITVIIILIEIFIFSPIYFNKVSSMSTHIETNIPDQLLLQAQSMVKQGWINNMDGWMDGFINC